MSTPLIAIVGRQMLEVTFFNRVLSQRQALLMPLRVSPEIEYTVRQVVW